MLGSTKHSCSKYFEISQEIWDEVSPFAGSQEENDTLPYSLGRDWVSQGALQTHADIELYGIL